MKLLRVGNLGSEIVAALDRTNSYETPYSGPETTTEERIKRFVK